MRKGLVGLVALMSALIMFVATAAPGGASISLVGNSVSCTNTSGALQIIRGLGGTSTPNAFFKWKLTLVATSCTGVGSQFPAESVYLGLIKAKGVDDGPGSSSCTNAGSATNEAAPAAKIIWTGGPQTIQATPLPSLTAGQFPTFTIDATGFSIDWPLGAPGKHVQLGGDWTSAAATTYALTCPVGTAPAGEYLPFTTPTTHTPAFDAIM